MIIPCQAKQQTDDTLAETLDIVIKIADALEPDGYLIIGSTESLTGVCPRFVPKRHLKSIFYQLR